MSYSDLVKKYDLQRDKDIDELYSKRVEEISKYEKDPKKIYEYFKSFTAIEEFYFARHQYQCDSILANDEPGEDDYSIINAELLELGNVSDNLKLKHPSTAKKLLAEAESAFIEGTIYEKDEVELMVYLLFKSDFFEKYPLPIISLSSSDCSGEPEYIFMIVYAKYILLYDYLVEKLGKTSATSITSITPTKKSIAKSTYEVKTETFSDIFRVIHKPKYELIIKLLSDDLPSKLTSITEYENLTHPFVITSDDGVSWNPKVKYAPSYLTGIYLACHKWLKPDISENDAIDILANTFKVEIRTRSAFNKKERPAFQKKYIEPFEILFETIK